MYVHYKLCRIDYVSGISLAARVVCFRFLDTLARLSAVSPSTPLSPPSTLWILSATLGIVVSGVASVASATQALSQQN